MKLSERLRELGQPGAIRTAEEMWELAKQAEALERQQENANWELTPRPRFDGYGQMDGYYE